MTTRPLPRSPARRTASSGIQGTSARKSSHCANWPTSSSVATRSIGQEALAEEAGTVAAALGDARRESPPSCNFRRPWRLPRGPRARPGALHRGTRAPPNARRSARPGRGFCLQPRRSGLRSWGSRTCAGGARRVPDTLARTRRHAAPGCGTVRPRRSGPSRGRLPTRGRAVARKPRDLRRTTRRSRECGVPARTGGRPCGHRAVRRGSAPLGCGRRSPTGRRPLPGELRVMALLERSLSSNLGVHLAERRRRDASSTASLSFAPTLQ